MDETVVVRTVPAKAVVAEIAVDMELEEEEMRLQNQESGLRSAAVVKTLVEISFMA